MKTYGPTTQCNSKIMDYVKCSNCPPLAITHALSPNHHQSVAWGMMVCLSIRRCLNLSTSRTGYWQPQSCSIAREVVLLPTAATAFVAFVPSLIVLQVSAGVTWWVVSHYFPLRVVQQLTTATRCCSRSVGCSDEGMNRSLTLPMYFNTF